MLFSDAAAKWFDEYKNGHELKTIYKIQYMLDKHILLL